MKKVLSERQKEILSVLRKHFRSNDAITVGELSELMDISRITAYEHLRNLKEKGILRVKMSFCKKKGRPKYRYVLTPKGKSLISSTWGYYLDEVKGILNEFKVAKMEGRLNEFLSKKISSFSKNTLKPLLFVVFGFLILVTLFRDIKEVETLKNLLIVSLSSKIVFVSFLSFTMFLFSRYVGGVENMEEKWEEIKYQFVSIPDDERREIVKTLLNFMNGGEKNECERKLNRTYS